MNFAAYQLGLLLLNAIVTFCLWGKLSVYNVNLEKMILKCNVFFKYSALVVLKYMSFNGRKIS